nr:hypothetical protein [Nocardia terpenica]
MIVTWLHDGGLRVGGLCGLRFCDLHLTRNHPCRQRADPHVHVVGRNDNPNRACAKSYAPATPTRDGYTVDGVLRAVSNDMISTFHAYLLDEFGPIQHLVDHEHILVHLTGATAGAALHTGGVRKMLRRACSRAGLNVHLVPHSFRHKAAARALCRVGFQRRVGDPGVRLVQPGHGHRRLRTVGQPAGDEIPAAGMGRQRPPTGRTVSGAGPGPRSRLVTTPDIAASTSLTSVPDSAAEYLGLSPDGRYDIVSQQFPEWLLAEPVEFPPHHPTYGWHCRVEGCEGGLHATAPSAQLCVAHARRYAEVKERAVLLSARRLVPADLSAALLRPKPFGQTEFRVDQLPGFARRRSPAARLCWSGTNLNTHLASGYAAMSPTGTGSRSASYGPTPGPQPRRGGLFSMRSV